MVVGTPGRLLDLARQGHLKLGKVRQLVLDEADKMLDLGFLPDVERILQLTPAARQTMLFSATMPGEVVTLARRHLSRPMHIRAEQHDEPAHVPSTEQHVFRAHQMDKIEVLARVLQAEGRGLTIVFSRTKRSADQVASTLTTKGFAAAAIHGDLGQSQRERAMRAFRSGKVDVLVATEVAARGLDVEDVTHVINYECPEDEKAYLHRIGRTGRAGREGVAVTFVDWNDLHRWKTINDALHLDFRRAGRDLLDVAHLYAALSIPAGATGVLPRAQRAGWAWRPSRSRTSARPARPAPACRRGAAHGLRQPGQAGPAQHRRRTEPAAAGRAAGAGPEADGPKARAPRTRPARVPAPAGHATSGPDGSAERQSGPRGGSQWRRRDRLRICRYRARRPGGGRPGQRSVGRASPEAATPVRQEPERRPGGTGSARPSKHVIRLAPPHDEACRGEPRQALPVRTGQERAPDRSRWRARRATSGGPAGTLSANPALFGCYISASSR